MEKAINEIVGERDKSEVSELTLDGTVSATIEGLTEAFTGLEVLSLNNIRLASLANLPQLPSLEKLELNDNRLTGGLEHIAASCPHLQFLSLMNNRLTDLEALRPLARLSELTQLDLVHNEGLTANPDYPLAVFDMLPNLVYLDGKDRDNNDMPEEEETTESSEEYDDEGESDGEEQVSDYEEDEEDNNIEESNQSDDDMAVGVSAMDQNSSGGESGAERGGEREGESGAESGAERGGEREGESGAESGGESDLAKSLEEGVEEAVDVEGQSSNKRQRTM